MSPIATRRAGPWATTDDAGAQRSVTAATTAIERMRHRSARCSILLDQHWRGVEGVLKGRTGTRRGLVLQVRIQRVITDVERLAGLPFIAVVLFEDIPRVAAAPGAHGVAALKRRHEVLGIVAA